MSLFDLQQRTDAILKKYEKYDAPMGKRRETKGDDPYQEEYDLIMSQVDDLNKQAEEVAAEKNRAIVAARNADIRKAKQSLLTDGIQALQKQKKKGKKVNKAVIEERDKQIQQLIEKIFSVPDGIGGNRRPNKPGVGLQLAKGAAITIGPIDPQQVNPMYYKQTDETAKFEQEWQYAKVRQDAQLERIEKGVSTLGDMARGMQEELDKQNPVIDDIDSQINKVTGQLKSNNARLTGLVTQMRSKRNFCIDIVLVCILLGIGAYIFTVATKKK
ncbi:hypothetical protein OEZ85_007413 [Tetradesmus obliquus]|uniref:Uncharacterized protein n=2 Tax=Tetradesmus obliquus TaxID=3088 RepID=A0A383VAA1_TETOB|nr:hypothetical protein OEZ85_007413 [Tetradesmus obliquus]|eukprot:jgi/Sobl393_1/16334/SZX62121.1